MRDFFKRFVLKRQKLDESQAEALRLDFQARYHHFKLLLNANNQALEIMADIDDALKGARPFGMTYVRAMSTRVSAQVFQIIKQMTELAPDRYLGLDLAFKEIQQQISPYLAANSLGREGPMVMPLEAADGRHVDQVGAKMANLGEMTNQIHIKVPNGFVVTANGYRHFLDHNDLQPEIERRVQAAEAERLDALYELSASLQQLIIRSEVPPDLKEAIEEQYRRLETIEGKGVNVALRSSALGEDQGETSFAGQYRSELNVSEDNLLHAYKEVIASKYGVTAMMYRLSRGIPHEEAAMPVGCLAMVPALSGGVLYSRNPMNIRDNTIIINAAWGLPKSVVDGRSAVDLFVVSRGEPLQIQEKIIAGKDHQLVCQTEEGVSRIELTDSEGSSPSLQDQEVLDLARLAIRLEEYYGPPQDIEWAIDKSGNIILLQCRPLQQQALKKKTALPQEKVLPSSVILHGGVTASPGVAAGPVFHVKKDGDVLQFPKDAVLVAAQALPSWAPLLGQAAAVVTAQGSFAGHLATVAREYGVPALFNLKGALDQLGNGRLITVDVDNLCIHEGRREELLKDQIKPKNLMAGSPVFLALKGAAQHITPLNLLDPDGPDFKPGNCRTFHDITRFCHEKAVQEMFRFGKAHRFPERSSKQLFCNVPMQWWVLNLDDGFEQEVTEKYVHIDNIVSIPMLALWEGITAIPWCGPPPLDSRGFMTVMYEATRNTALTTGVPSSYASRNYFMISSNYCNLNSRLGFHFSLVESLVGKRPGENYISFQFKGGAADYERRRLRVHFVKDLLAQYDFNVEINKDTLIARLEGFEKEYMISRLKILGYLTIHTRQLDMIMSNPGSVNHYREKLTKEIRRILSNEIDE